MKKFAKQVFHHVYDRPRFLSREGNVYEDMEFEDCQFSDCALSITTNPARRSIVRNVALLGCSQVACYVRTAVVEGVTIETLRCERELQVWGAAFKHVVLRGEIGRFVATRYIVAAESRSRQQTAFDEANSRYYASVDWALDIREAIFKHYWLGGVPAKLIVRDPETQAVLTREKAAAGVWRSLEFGDSYWSDTIERFLLDQEADTVLVAPKGAPHFARYAEDLERLRRAGVAEPD